MRDFLQSFLHLTGESVVNKPPFPYHPLVTEAEVGPEQTGEVSADLRLYRMFLVRSDMTGILEPVVEKFTDPAVFNALRVGTRVKFRVTLRYPRVVSISIISFTKQVIVGPEERIGTIELLCPELSLCCILEDGTRCQFSVLRDEIGSAVFDGLKVGDVVLFRSNEHGCITEINT